MSRFRRAARRTSADELVLIEGLTLVEEAARAGWTIATLAATVDRVEDDAHRRELERITVDGDRLIVPRTVLDALSPASSPSGVVALARRPLADASPFAPDPALVVIASDVQDPGNVGAIARSAEAAGATGLLVCGKSADPFGWKALRGSMGSAFRLPIMRFDSATDAIRLTRAQGLRLLALDTSGDVIVHDVDMRSGLAVMAGGEGAGLTPDELAAADLRVRIPMKAPVESLNVAVATGILVYEAARQRADDADGGRRRSRRSRR